LENEGKIQLEKDEETTSTKMTMISFGSFDPIPLPSLLCKMKVIFDANDSSNHLSQGALPVQFKMDGIKKIVWAYLGTPLYELMIEDLEDLQSSSKYEDDIGDGLSTFI
jgi:hypothetical protein